jgi:methylmalonyl-CoA mutase
MFPPLSTADWQAKLHKDLKGATTFEDLHWTTPEGLRFAPFYHSDTAQTPPVVPFAKDANTWQINEMIRVTDVKGANEIALAALNGGAESLHFVLDNALTMNMMRTLLDSVFIEMVALNFSGQWVWRNATAFWDVYTAILAERNLPTTDIYGTIAADVTDTTALFAFADRLTDYPHLRCIDLYGAGTMVQQLQGIIAVAKRLTAAQPQLLSRIQVSMPVGNSFMLEVAKLRALRLLWCEVITADVAPHIHAFTAPMCLTDDANYNKIAATTEAMSAIIGGADALTVTPSDSKLGEPTLFSRRLARNVQHILRLEGHLDKVIDPSAGSYYIETMTQELCAKAREQGGF